MKEVPEISAAGLEIVALMNVLPADPLGTSSMGEMRLGSVGRTGFGSVDRRREKWLFEKHIDSIDERRKGDCVVQWRPIEGGRAGTGLRSFVRKYTIFF